MSDITEAELPKVSVIEEAVIDFAARQTKRIPAPVILIVSLVAIIASRYVPIWMCIAWVGLIVAMLVIRAKVIPAVSTSESLTVKEKIRIIVILGVVTGGSQALSLFAFPFFSEAERGIQTMMLISLCAGAVATTTGYRPFVLAYMIPILIPLIGLWLFSPGIELSNWVKYTTAIIVIFSTMIFIVLAADIYRLFESSFYIRKEQQELNRMLEVALDEAESANHAKTRFLAAASHDLRQPLHTMSLFSSALSMQPLPDKANSIVENLKNSMDSLSSQLDSLLDISKLDAGVVELSKFPLELGPFIRSLGDELRLVAEEKNLTFSMELDEDSVIQTDHAQFERILRNIIGNAIKYTNSGGISLKCRNLDDKVKIVITDTGVGIPADKQSLVFEEFFQVDNPQRDKQKGLGLGLSIVKRTARLLDIGLELESKQGEGTAMTLTIDREQGIERSLEPNLENARRDRLDSKTILVVDDEEMILRGMNAALTELGATVITAENGVQGILEAERVAPDIVISDYQLGSEMNGLEVLKKVCELNAECKPVLISGDINVSTLKEVNDAGVEMLHKPVRIEELVEKLA